MQNINTVEANKQKGKMKSAFFSAIAARKMT
jgi:hypothetical protein